MVQQAIQPFDPSSAFVHKVLDTEQIVTQLTRIADAFEEQNRINARMIAKAEEMEAYREEIAPKRG